MMTCALVLTGAAVYAQSPSVECRICSDMLSGWAKTKQTAAVKKTDVEKADSIDLAVKRATVKQAREAAKAAEKSGSVQSNKTDSSYPSYFYGREGHMMALGEVVAQKISAPKAKSAAKQAPGQTAKKAAPQKEEASLLKAIFLGGRFPGETEEQYKVRRQVQASPAGQPFK